MLDLPTTTEGQPQVGTTDLLAAFGLGPRACEDCGQVFTVPPYMECAKWKHCTPCSGKRFNEWIKTPEAKKAIEMCEAGIGAANAIGEARADSASPPKPLTQ